MVERMSKHRASSSSVLTAALLVGGFVVLGVLIAAIAMAQEKPDPLDRPDVVVGAPSVEDVRQRSVDAGDTSREMERVSTLPDRHEALIAKRQLMRQEARQKERRQERREAADQAQQEVTSVVASPSNPPSGSGTGSGTPSGGLPALLQLIRSNESGGNYSAYNGSGCEGYGCFGAYQLHGAYMDDWARSYGAASYASTPANQWPAEVQDRVALGLFYSTNPDGAHWCNWTDYC